MAHKTAPGGTLLDTLNEGEEGERCTDPDDCGEEGRSASHDHRSRHGDRYSAHRYGSTRALNPDALGLLNIYDQLVAALCDARMGARHRCHCRQMSETGYLGGRNPSSTDDSNSDVEDAKHHVKIPPPVFKELPAEWPDAHLLATEDWMEAMCFHRNEYVDKFKHTLQHLS